MEINYDDAPEADSSSFVEIKLKKKKVSLAQKHIHLYVLDFDGKGWLVVALSWMNPCLFKK